MSPPRVSRIGSTVSLLIGAKFLALACGGDAFSGQGSGDGGAGPSLAGAPARAGGSGQSGSSAGEASSTAGGASSGEQGEAGGGASAQAGAETSASGAGPIGSCEALGAGLRFAQHCYVDATAATGWTHLAASEQCESLGETFGRQGHLLILDSPEEQAFVVEHFMAGFEATHDAWLALTCSSADHSDLTDCFCVGCDEAALFAKRQNWQWPGGFSTGFGWHAQSPNGDGRCTALTHKTVLPNWGWGDRDCAKEVFPGIDRNYRVICELQ